MSYSRKNVDRYRSQFRLQVWDNSINDADCDVRIKPTYENIYEMLWHQKCRAELPLILTRLSVQYDSVLQSYFVQLPETALAWIFPNNKQISESLNTDTSIRNIYVERNINNQVCSYFPYTEYTNSFWTLVLAYTETIATIIVLESARKYLRFIKSYDEAKEQEMERDKKINLLNRKYAQQFISNENDGYEDMKINIQ